jgi:hypothetical protein
MLMASLQELRTRRGALSPRGSVGSGGQRTTSVRGGRTSCGARGPHPRRGLSSSRVCDAGLIFHGDHSCGQATPPQGR